MYQQQPVGRHMFIPLTDDELRDAKRLALDADMTMKDWTRMVFVGYILEHKKPLAAP